MDISKYKTTADAAKILHRHQFSVSAMCQRGVFPGAHKIGKTWLIPIDEIPLAINLKPGAKPKSSL